MVRSIQDWADVIAMADATHEGDAQAAARRILKDMLGYRKVTRSFQPCLETDIANLANALQAYTKLLQDAGVKV